MTKRALISENGSTSQVANGDKLLVGTGIETADNADTLIVGADNTAGITIGAAGITTTFPGDIDVQGNANTVGGTTFTSDLQFGDDAADNISFVGQIDSAMTVEGIAAPAVSPATTGRLYFDQTANKFKVSENTGAYVDLVVSPGASTLQEAYEGGNTITTDATNGDLQIEGTESFIVNMGNGVAIEGGSVVPILIQSDVASIGAVTIVANDPAGGVTVTSGAAGTTIDTSSGGDIRVEANNDVLVDADNDINLTALGGFAIEAGAAASTIQVLGADLTVQATVGGSVTVNGSNQAILQAGNDAKVVASGDVTIESQGVEYTWPSAQGSSGQALVTDGNSPASVLSWADVAVSPAGLNTEIQFNDAGSFGANGDFTYDGTSVVTLGTVSGGAVFEMGEGTAPTGAAGVGKLWATSAADARPYWLDDTGQSYNLTLDRFETITPVSGTPDTASIDVDPALPVYKEITLANDTDFSTANLGDGRGASVKIEAGASARSLTWPAWSWLGVNAPTTLDANETGFLSIVAYGATDADVVAAWSYTNQPSAVVGTGADNQIAVWSGASTQDGSSSLTFDGTDLLVGATPALGVNVSTDAITLRGVSYTFPAADGSTDEVLTTDGAGNLSWSAIPTGESVDISGTAGEALLQGDLVVFLDDAGTPKIYKADATSADNRPNPVGFATAAASAGAAVVVRVAGSAPALFAAAPAAASVGSKVYMSATTGQVTLTAPTSSGDLVQRVGILVLGGASPLVLVQMGDAVTIA